MRVGPPKDEVTGRGRGEKEKEEEGAKGKGEGGLRARVEGARARARGTRRTSSLSPTISSLLTSEVTGNVVRG